MKERITQFLSQLQANGMRKNSLDAYGRDVRLMADWLQSQGIGCWTQVGTEDIEAYSHALIKSGKANATIARQLASQRRFVKYLRETGYDIESAVSKAVVRPVRKPLLILEREQVEALLRSPDISTMMGLRDYLMLKMLYETGIRVSEIIDLTIGDVDFKRKRILCSTPYESRMVYLNPDLTKRLKRYLSLRAIDLDQKDQALFANCYGQNISRQGLWKIVKIHAEAANLDRAITPHTLRHSLAVHLLQEGGSLKHLQMIMGHQDVTSTQIYASYIDLSATETLSQDTVI